ncbi:MAG TPA: hypothetical protein VGO40_09320 [Longimicrobium sp.]|nr:hypothetical protein [Longimicrobium sp.]
MNNSMRTRFVLGLVALLVIVVSGVAAYFLDGTAQVRAWGLVILGIGSLFLTFGGFDIGSVDEAGPEKLGYIGLLVGALMMLGGAIALINGTMPGGMGIPDWLKHEKGSAPQTITPTLVARESASRSTAVRLKVE